MQRRIIYFTAILVSFLAIYVCADLTKKHLSGKGSFSWFDSACSAEEGGFSGADCEQVLNSPFGVFPFEDPRDANEKDGAAAEAKSDAEGDVETESDDKLPVLIRFALWAQSQLYGKEIKTRTPVSLIGMSYYCLILIWLVGVGTPSHDMRWLYQLLLVIASLAFAGCLFFIYVMIVKTDAWCPWCVVSHLLNLCLLICLFMLRPVNPGSVPSPAGQADVEANREDKGIKQSQAKSRSVSDNPGRSSEPSVAHRISHPSLRLLGVTILAMLLANGVINSVFLQLKYRSQSAQNSDRYERCSTSLRKLAQDGVRMYKNWLLNEKKEVEIGENPRIRGGNPGVKSVTIVVFSDLECPHCARFAHFIDNRVQPMFDGNLKVVFKHYPLDDSCNQYVKKSMHPYACKAAAFAEVARFQQGNDGFWGTHDFFYEHRSRIKRIGSDGLLEEFCSTQGLDIDQFRKDWDERKEDYARAIYDDIQQGKELKLRATPTVFLQSRKVDGLARGSIEFWDQIAKIYWRARKEKRPEHTKLSYLRDAASLNTEDDETTEGNLNP